MHELRNLSGPNLHQLLALVAFFTIPSTAATTSWFHSSPFKRVAAGDAEARVRLIDGGEPHQEYHDGPDTEGVRDSAAEQSNADVNGNRPRIEPSGLPSGGEGWGGEH